MERHSEAGLSFAGPRQAARLLGRAMVLRCPHCGGGPVLQHWFRMRERCGTCGLRIERGEHDYWIGSMMFNLVLSELIFAAVFVAVLIARWPNVPWDTMQWAAPLMMLAAPAALFPFSKLIWLAFDLMLRPMTAAELEWHQGDDTA